MKTLTWQKPGQQNVAQELIKIIINYVAELRLYKGPYDNLQAVYDTIYGKYLPEMECTIRDEASAERYLNNPCDTPPEELLTEIYIPVE